MKTVIYCRVGTKLQTIEGQKELCLQALEQDDDLVEVFEDVGFSGLDDERPGLLQLRDGAKKGLFDKVVTTEPKVLFRDVVKLIEFQQELGQLGIALKYANSKSRQIDDLLDEIRSEL